MKNFLLLAVFAAVVQFSGAQAPLANSGLTTMRDHKLRLLGNPEGPVVLTPQQNTTTTTGTASRNSHASTRANNEKSLANGTPLQYQAIGSAGNLLTITNGNCNQLSVIDSLNIVAFVHRSDDILFPAQNVAEYSFDFSADRGTTWKSNIGPITRASNINNNGTNAHGRFPQGTAFNPAGNTLADSAYLVYNGTYHNSGTATSGSWAGQLVGRGQFTGDSGTFNVHIDTINNGVTSVATGMCNGTPGVFWAINLDDNFTFATGSNDIIKGIIVEKGVWNPNTRDVNWTATEIPTQFDSTTSGSNKVSVATAFDISFDPTGQYGWIACLGDITHGPTDSVYHPIFWQSVDSGNTWTGPTQIKLDSIPNVIPLLNKVTLYPGSATGGVGATTSGIPSTTFEGKLTVDYLGNPHYFTTVGSGNGYSIELGAGYDAYDITLNPANACAPTWNGWAAIFVDSIQTLSGATTPGDGTASELTEDNRPLVSRSADGKNLFFFWSASDESYVTYDANSDPNLFTRAFDLVNSTSTVTQNLTQGDPNFGGATSVYAAGNFTAAFYPTVAPVAMSDGAGGYIVPLVLTEIDYSNPASLTSTGPAQFWYVSNVDFSVFSYTNALSASISLVGSDTVTVALNSTYNDSGAVINYLDTACTHSGLLHIITNGSGVHTNAPGTYYYYYSAVDSVNQVYANAVRVVIVVSKPLAKFVYAVQSPTVQGYPVQFTDSSLYSPNFWSWTFGDGGSVSGSTQNNPVHVYTALGTYNVCLVASNITGADTFCQNVVVVNTGIKEADFASSVNMFPNPTSGNVNITLNANAAVDFTVSVYNILGDQVIATSDYKAGTTNVELNAVTLADGVYLVKIQSNQGSAVKRLTVSHK